MWYPTTDAEVSTFWTYVYFFKSFPLSLLFFSFIFEHTLAFWTYPSFFEDHLHASTFFSNWALFRPNSAYGMNSRQFSEKEKISRFQKRRKFHTEAKSSWWHLMFLLFDHAFGSLKALLRVLANFFDLDFFLSFNPHIFRFIWKAWRKDSLNSSHYEKSNDARHGHVLLAKSWDIAPDVSITEPTPPDCMITPPSQ